ncbi:MAG: HAD family hydrolase [Oscillospiraceae bacterium]|jgi:phosphoglycolate phosphatase|nr:HAD family hydrolase [Oscillospiraceae bacterium]
MSDAAMDKKTVHSDREIFRTRPNKLNTIIWDWNGTLLDDADICVEVENSLLRERGIEPLLDKSRYQEIFGFPVIDYYRRAGLSFETESYQAIADIYINRYTERSRACGLFPDARAALESLNAMGFRQVIISASHSGLLLDQIRPFRIENYFDYIIGQDDAYAHGKKEAALRWMRDCGIDNKTTVLVGDTTHDYEVACALGCGCVLVRNGHHSRERLEKCGCHIADSLTEAVNNISNLCLKNT